MARNNKFKRNRRKIKRFFKKRKNNYRITKNTVMYPNSRSVFPYTFYNKMHYRSAVLLAPNTANGVCDFVWSMNDIYRPFKTQSAGFSVSGLSGFASSCNGLDKLTSLYDSWTVYASKIKLKIVSTGTTSALGNGLCTLRDSENSAAQTFANCADRVGDNRTKTAIIQMGGNKQTVLSNYMTSKQAFGSNEFKYDLSYQGVDLLGPVNQRYWHLSIFGDTNLLNSTPPGCLINVEITYFVRWGVQDALTPV